MLVILIYNYYDTKYHNRDDYNSLTSDIFQTVLLNVRPLVHCLSNAMYGCPIKLGTNVAINGFVQSFLKIHNHLCTIITIIVSTLIFATN